MDKTAQQNPKEPKNPKRQRWPENPKPGKSRWPEGQVPGKRSPQKPPTSLIPRETTHSPLPDTQRESKQEKSTSQESLPVKAIPTLPAAVPSVFEVDDFLGEVKEVIRPEDEERERFKEFLNTQWGLPATTVLFRGLFSGGFPPIPAPNRWNIPNDINVIKLVWEQTQTEGFINEIWPSVRMMLQDDTCNFQWAAQVATVLAFFNIIKVLPIVLEGDENVHSEN